ncbi:DUF4149 domain-containing protein [Mycetohabitans sp. B5]|uniref:Uncharacterized protein DUF4149 n=1 Tax=Mycetohabitans endofungorum TaxID=417203 RepID=A0A2P5KET5_9BURK|nr:DUF4149 domain-containing protein [Mycetohabitans sp. B5]MCG1054030.1 DUF4149 domain-containing protein [Mycetohabitans sp. B5]PPB85199.1 uncharacterized protein DUF4149 [Mycetohabitans endofungorum]
MIAQRLFRLLAMLWVGSLVSTGYLAAPTLFASLDRVSAGTVAASLFHTQAVIGVVAGIVLLGFAHAFVKRGDRAYRAARWVIIAMLVCVLVGYFALQPFMNELRVAAQQAGTDVGDSAYAARFGALHFASSAIYLVQSLLGLVLVWRLPVATRSMF